DDQRGQHPFHPGFDTISLSGPSPNATGRPQLPRMPLRRLNSISAGRSVSVVAVPKRRGLFSWTTLQPMAALASQGGRPFLEHMLFPLLLQLRAGADPEFSESTTREERHPEFSVSITRESRGDPAPPCPKTVPGFVPSRNRFFWSDVPELPYKVW